MKQGFHSKEQEKSEKKREILRTVSGNEEILDKIHELFCWTTEICIF